MSAHVNTSAFKKVVLSGVSLMVLSQAASALTAEAITGVNVRSGPGVSFGRVDALEANEVVNITECQSGWCYVEQDGANGWVSGRYLRAIDGGSVGSSGSGASGSGSGSAASDSGTDPVAAAIMGAILGAVIKEVTDEDPEPAPAAAEPDEVEIAPTLPSVTLVPLLPKLVPGTYLVQQASNGRYLDAHEISDKDYRVVTRTWQGNATQMWMFSESTDGYYRIQQVVNMRYLDAHEGIKDNSIVTRTLQPNHTQDWQVTKLANGNYHIRQRSNGRFMDAHEGINDSDVVTRDNQGNNTQEWVLTRR